MSFFFILLIFFIIFFFFFFFNDTATTEIYTLSLHERSSDLIVGDRLRVSLGQPVIAENVAGAGGTIRSEEHTCELQSRLQLVCRLMLEKKNQIPHAPVQSHTRHFKKLCRNLRER